ncbi:MAG: polyprenyl synthetase family protein [Eubacteriales bacterium]|nr:polyprenyl synthetase family protein [Eubacteriales bacterium]
MDFDSKSNKYLKKVELWLREYLDGIDDAEGALSEAVIYSLTAGGKRLRPLLFLSVAEILGLEDICSKPYACAIEMIHTYSLIHDDLPAMDDDDMRRGKPSNHIVFGEGMAILAGDALLNLSFEIMNEDARASSDSGLLRRKIDAAGFIANASGLHGMISGQAIDLKYRNLKISENLLKKMHSKKTGALIRASVMVPAILAGADGQTIASLEKYASGIGLGFQIKDDILDAEGNAEILGKPTGNDILQNKSTFVSLYGKDESKKMLESVINESIGAISDFKEKAEFLIHLANFIQFRDK